MFPKCEKKYFCAYCNREIHNKKNGGYVWIPCSITHFVSYKVWLHDKCLKSYIKSVEFKGSVEK